MKKTAVERLLENLKQVLPINQMNDIVIQDLFKQAKEIEKQQIIDAFWNGDNTDCLSEQNAKEFAEQYYNETYKKD